MSFAWRETNEQGTVGLKVGTNIAITKKNEVVSGLLAR